MSDIRVPVGSSDGGQFAPRDRKEADLVLDQREPLPELSDEQAPAGDYYVGDPCYAFDHDEWGALLEQTGLAGRDGAGAAYMPDGRVRRVWMIGTAYGDGAYPDADGKEYSVDSGTLGLVPLNEIDPARLDNLREHGNIVSFAKPVDISEEDGSISFGHLTIDTGDPDPDPCENCGKDTDGEGYCWRCGARCEECNNYDYDCDGECANCADCGDD